MDLQQTGSGAAALTDMREVLCACEERLEQTTQFVHRMQGRSFADVHEWADLAAALAALSAWLWDASDAVQARIRF